MDYIISREINTDRLYAYAKNRFWYWNESMHDWKESHLMSQTYEKTHAADARLSPEDFMSDCARFNPLESFEVDYLMKQALKNAEPCKTVPVEPVKEVPPESSLQDKPLNFVPDNMTPSFDYSGLTDQTVEDLHFAEDEYRHGKQMAERGLVHMGNAIAAAHDALCGVVQQLDNSKHGNRGDDSFRAWCCSIGITKSTAYNLLQVSSLMSGSSPRQRAILEALPPTLLYAVAKPSAPEELVEKVKNGEIATNKQYQELLAQLKAKDEALSTEKERADAAEAREEEVWKTYNAESSKRQKAEADLKETRARLDSACIQEQNAHDAMQAAESARDAALADVQGLSEQNRRLKAENADLKKGVTVTAVIDEEEVDRRAAEKAWGLADARNAELQADKEKLQADKEQLQKEKADLLEELAEVRASKSADPAEDRENAEACLINFGGIWGMARPAFLRLIGTGESFNTTAHAVQQFCDRVHAELVQMMIQNDKETQYE